MQKFLIHELMQIRNIPRYICEILLIYLVAGEVGPFTLLALSLMGISFEVNIIMHKIHIESMKNIGETLSNIQHQAMTQGKEAQEKMANAYASYLKTAAKKQFPDENMMGDFDDIFRELENPDEDGDDPVGS